MSSNNDRIEHDIPKGYVARIVGNKVVLEKNSSDEERIRSVLFWMVRDVPSVKGILFANGISVDKALDWLLHANWKPSPEQKNALLDAIAVAREFPEDNVNVSRLQGLYDDLEKL